MAKEVCGQFFRGLLGRPHVGVYGVADFLLKLTCLNNFSAENVTCQFHAFFGNTLSDVPHKTGLLLLSQASRVRRQTSAFEFLSTNGGFIQNSFS